jgi:hypothetical protein
MKNRGTRKPIYQVQSVIVCDDVRQETSGKEILIGVYNSLAYVKSFPALFPRICFRLAVNVDPPGVYSFTIIIEEGTGRSFIQVAHSVEVTQVEAPALIGVVLQQFVADKPMVLLVRFGLDREPEIVAKFKVRLPVSDEESNRISPPPQRDVKVMPIPPAARGTASN